MAEERAQKKAESHDSLAILLGFLFLIIIGLILGIVFIRNMVQSEWPDDGSDSEDEVNNGINYPVEIENITNRIEEEINMAETAEEKATLYIRRAGEIYNLIFEANIDEWDAVCDDAYKAEELAPNFYSAEMIYNCENGRGDEEMAERYLEISRERMIAEGLEGGG